MASPAHRDAPDDGRRQPGRVLDHPKGYAQVMNDVARSGKLTLQELGAYTLIVGYSGPTGECWQTQERLAEYAGITERQMRRHVQALIARGFLAERIRRPSLGEEKGRSLRVSDAWRYDESQDTGVRRLHAEPESHRTPVSESEDTGVRTHRTPVSALKRTRLKEPGKDPVNGADAPAPPPPTAPAEVVVRRRATRAPAEETDAPEPADFELTPAIIAYGASLGYDEARVRVELYSCLDWFGARKLKRADWARTFRNWLTREWKLDRQRGAESGYRSNGHAAPARTNGQAGGERAWTGKPGSPTSTDARQIAQRKDWDL